MGWVLWNFRERFYDSIEARRELNIFSFFKKKRCQKKSTRLLYFCQKSREKAKIYPSSAFLTSWQFFLDLFDCWVIGVHLQAPIAYKWSKHGRILTLGFFFAFLALLSHRLCFFSCYFLIWLHSLSISDRMSLLFTTYTHLLCALFLDDVDDFISIISS